MECHLRWNALSLPDWQDKFAVIKRSNLLQSYDYALAMRVARFQTPRWAQIFIDGNEAGLVQIFQVRLLGGITGAVTCDRGPLWLDGYGSDEHFEAFMEAFSKAYPKRLFWRRRMIPEHPPCPELDRMMQDHGFKRQAGDPYKTLWLDLTQDEGDLKAAMHKNWRNALHKAERETKDGKVTFTDTPPSDYPDLLRLYDQDRKARIYQGPDARFVATLSRITAASNNFLMGRLNGSQGVQAFIVIYKHGAVATYQIGWTSALGREKNAHNLLLWRAALILKEQGIVSFDLGGIHDKEPGIFKFKKNMGARLGELGALYS